MIRDHISDDDWAATYSSVPSDLRVIWAGTHEDGYDRDDDVEVNDMDRFQDVESGWAYRITVDYDARTRTEARLLADLIRATVRQYDFRIPCHACGGSRWTGPWKDRRRCTACTDGTVVENPAVVTFEAPGEVGSEATPYSPPAEVTRLLAEGQERRERTLR